MASYIASVYAEVIRKTKTTGKTIEDVPEGLKEEVLKLLENMTYEERKTAETSMNMDELVRVVRTRVAAGENLRAIINSLDLTDEEKWELERKVKEG